MSEQHHHALEEQQQQQNRSEHEQQQQSKSERKRIRYTSQLKLKLIQLCIQNGDRYIETTPEEDFWSYIRTLFPSVTECNTGNGSTIRRKVADIVSERKAAIAIRQTQSGVAIAPPTDLEQAIDTWIEWMDRRGEEKQAKIAHSTQIRQEKEKAAIKRQNLGKSLSEKRTFQEVAAVDLTDGDTIRDKRRMTGQVWASGKDKEMQENWDRLDRRTEEMLALMRDILKAISATPRTSASPSSAKPSSAGPSSANHFSVNPSFTNPSFTNSSSANPSSANPSSANPSSANPGSDITSDTGARFAALEAEISGIRGTQLEILRILSEMRK
ncbi:hypothetical protein BGX38DRAFT_1219473 [Terfezia claveryi]|nr:hypothetical protein BGX38DRAFT_1219473 [Terfezia claveryi]